VPLLFLQSDASHVVTLSVFVFAPCPHASIKILVAILERAHDKITLAVQRNRLSRPPSIPTLIVGHVPFRLVKRVTVEFVVPDKFPGLSVWRGREVVFEVFGPSCGDDRKNDRCGKQCYEFHVVVLEWLGRLRDMPSDAPSLD